MLLRCVYVYVVSEVILPQFWAFFGSGASQHLVIVVVVVVVVIVVDVLALFLSIPLPLDIYSSFGRMSAPRHLLIGPPIVFFIDSPFPSRRMDLAPLAPAAYMRKGVGEGRGTLVYQPLK